MSKNSWREAASILIAARTPFQQNTNNSKGCGFKILMLRRGKTSPFLPGRYVFPGGVVHSSDEAKEWVNLIRCYTDKNGHTSLENAIGNINSPVALKILSLRLTAIRETFEECGILLCKNKHVHSNRNAPTMWTSYFAGFEVEEWRNKVIKDPNTFFELCKYFDCVPDIWGLHEWSHWLTPTSEKLRFDARFFLSVLDHMPPASVNKTEMDEMKWASASEFLNLSKNGEIWLAPTQIYEIARLKHFQEINELATFAHDRASSGCVQWMPLHIKTSDGLLFILPGDDLYPTNPDIFTHTELKEVPDTLMDLRKGCEKLHRIEYIHGKEVKILVSSIETCCDHILPANS